MLSRKAWGNFPVEQRKGYTGVVKRYTSARVGKGSQTGLALLDKAGKAYGVQFVVVDKLSKANGMYGGGNTVYVAMDGYGGGERRGSIPRAAALYEGLGRGVLQGAAGYGAGNGGQCNPQIQSRRDNAPPPNILVLIPQHI